MNEPSSKSDREGPKGCQFTLRGLFAATFLLALLLGLAIWADMLLLLAYIGVDVAVIGVFAVVGGMLYGRERRREGVAFGALLGFLVLLVAGLSLAWFLRAR